MDKFFTQTRCDRCGGTLSGGRTMSRFNTDCIGLKCEAEERKRPDYKKAADAEIAEIKKGNFNYKGIDG